MDLLKRELERKRKSLREDFGDKKMMKRSEIEQKNIQKLRHQEHLEIQSKSLNPNSSLNTSSSSSTSSTNPNSSSSSSSDNKTDNNSNKSSNLSSSLKPDSSNEQKIEEPVLPRQEVIRRLRFFKQPITLFGEDDVTRLDRLKLLLKAGILDTVDNDMTEGQTNDFLRDMSELRKRQKTGHLQHRKKEGGGNGEEGGGAGDEDPDGDGGLSSADADKDLKRMKSKFEDLCQEDKILVFFKRLLNEWGQELQEMTDTERRTAKGKAMVATHKQCARYLNPLFKFCRKKVLPDDIRQALMVVVECCIKRDYLAAMDQYIKLAIGNAPWPIGVTMVGIHERSAREKIYTNSVAHIMNDETTRKYLQSVKRLMTFCQRRYPSMPSKAVEFNSLANGSDLQSLLNEERANSSDKLQEERLMLMPMPAAPSSN